MRSIVQYDPSLDLQFSQLLVKCRQCTFRIIEIASALIDRNIYILRAEIFDEVDDLVIPILTENDFVMPVNTGNEDFLALNIWNGFVGGGSAATSQEYGNEVDGKEEGTDEGDCSEPSRASGASVANSQHTDWRRKCIVTILCSHRNEYEGKLHIAILDHFDFQVSFSPTTNSSCTPILMFHA